LLTAVVFVVLVTALLLAIGRFRQTNRQHVADAARLEIREQFHLLARLIDRAVGGAESAAAETRATAGFGFVLPRRQ